MTEEQERAIYEAQAKWLKEHFPVNLKANIGWAVDEVAGTVSTKVYGYGILTTGIDLVHQFEPFEEDERSWNTVADPNPIHGAKVHSSKDQETIAELAKNLNDRLHFEIHFDDKTEVTWLPTYLFKPGNVEDWYEAEAGRIILDKTTVHFQGARLTNATLFMTVDIDGGWNRYALFNAEGIVMSTGLLTEDIGS